ncbi:MAG: hypothetical protein DRP47_06720 [Candidatus Zixiibacteriota bacterium]|nr:MAG: hypothetical protein DRP47_06720 [candidate division Zixibacteria bacterium]
MVDIKKRHKRPFIGVYFKCCRVYSRIYLNKAGTAFVGWCPKCARKTVVRVSPTGSKERIFTAG